MSGRYTHLRTHSKLQNDLYNYMKELPRNSSSTISLVIFFRKIHYLFFPCSKYSSFYFISHYTITYYNNLYIIGGIIKTFPPLTIAAVKIILIFHYFITVYNFVNAKINRLWVRSRSGVVLLPIQWYVTYLYIKWFVLYLIRSLLLLLL